jgi:LacI family transcriptional regulator
MYMQVTIVDIAKRLNISHTTVSRVLNNRQNRFISESTRKRVLEISQEMGYRPNQAARALVTGRTGRIAFWSPAMGARFYQEVAYQFHNLLQNDKYEMMVGEFGPQLMDPEKALGITRLDVDGVLMFGGTLGRFRNVLEKNFPAKAPIVNLGALCEGSLDYVHIDIYPAAVEAVQHLVDTGCKRIAHVYTPYEGSENDARYRVYHQVLSQAGLVPELITVPDWRRATVRQTIRDYVRSHGCPDAMFCANDEFALAVLRGLRDTGRKVPDDVRLVGCDGIEDLEYLDSPISTITQPMEEMCCLSWDFLKRRMANTEIPQQTKTLRAKFLVRS